MSCHAKRVHALLAVFAFLFVLTASTRAAATLHVDVDNTSGIENGTTLRPYATIQAALDAAPSGEDVRVAQGLYAENVVISDKVVALRGGYVGGAPGDYAGGSGGNFAASNPSVNVTHIDGSGGSATVLLEYTAASGSSLDGFTISGGAHGIKLDTTVTFPHIADVTISRNIFEDNGVAEYEHRGGGISLSGTGHQVEDNIIRNNVSGRGAAIELGGESITVTRNLIENNVGYSDHAGAINQYGTATISHNVFLGNRTGETLGYGWGGAVLVLGTATLRHNSYTGNHAPSIGGALFVDDGGTMILEHELIYGNTAQLGAAIYVDGYGDEASSHVDIRHCTIAGNIGGEDSVGNAVYVELNSTASFLNSVLWDNGGDDFYADGTSSITATYTLSQEPIAGAGNIAADPLFADAENADFHLQSTAGRFVPDAKGETGTWVLDLADSPAIDVGNPASPFSLEPSPNGGRANLGAYGNTPEASKSSGNTEGAADGEGEADGEGSPDGEGATEGEGEMDGEGSAEGEGSSEGEGASEGEGSTEGEGSVDGEGEEIPLDFYVQLLYTFASAEYSGNGLVDLDEIQSQLDYFTQEALNAADANGDNQLSVAELLERIGGGILMSADINGDYALSLAELLRTIQLYNSGRYYCAANAGASEDGFRVLPPAGAEPNCVPHSLDRDANKVVSLSELLRGIQFFNLGGYSYCGELGAEDGFCER